MVSHQFSSPDSHLPSTPSFHHRSLVPSSWIFFIFVFVHHSLSHTPSPGTLQPPLSLSSLSSLCRLGFGRSDPHHSVHAISKAAGRHTWSAFTPPAPVFSSHCPYPPVRNQSWRRYPRRRAAGRYCVFARVIIFRPPCSFVPFLPGKPSEFSRKPPFGFQLGLTR